jgi:hypothetical protein
VCGIGSYPSRQFIPGKELDFNRLREFIEILQSLILSSFVEQSIKKKFAKQNAYWVVILLTVCACFVIFPKAGKFYNLLRLYTFMYFSGQIILNES